MGWIQLCPSSFQDPFKISAGSFLDTGVEQREENVQSGISHAESKSSRFNLSLETELLPFPGAQRCLIFRTAGFPATLSFCLPWPRPGEAECPGHSQHLYIENIDYTGRSSSSNKVMPVTSITFLIYFISEPLDPLVPISSTGSLLPLHL